MRNQGCSRFGRTLRSLTGETGQEDMTATFTGNNLNDNQFSMTGDCPHCNRPSNFVMVTAAYAEPLYGASGHVQLYTLWAVLRCIGCSKYLLASVEKSAAQTAPFRVFYQKHYPVGTANDDVPSEIPIHIAADFKEALRCRFVDAHNATVEMCRRAVQASCFQLGAPDDKLVKQIDWLAAQGTITKPLQQMAHRVRLGGNLGAHPPEDPSDPSEIIIGSEYADAVIEFTRDFFQHVYVMPERLKKFTFKKTSP